MSGPLPQVRAPSPHPQVPGQAGLQSPSPCRCRHPGAGSRGWPRGAQQSPQRKRQPQRPGGAPMRVRWALRSGLGLSWGKHMKMGQKADCHTRQGPSSSGPLQHPDSRLPGAGESPEQASSGTLPSMFRPPPKPSSLSPPWSGPRPLPTTPTLVHPRRTPQVRFQTSSQLHS